MSFKKKFLALSAGAAISIASVSVNAAILSFFQDTESVASGGGAPTTVEATNPFVATVAPSGAFDVTVYGTEFTVPTAGFEFTINWDPAVIEFVSAPTNPNVHAPWDFFSNATAGSMTVILDGSLDFGDPPVSGDFGIADFTFNVKDTAALGPTSLSFTNVEFYDELATDIAVTSVNGSVSVVPVPAAVWLFGSALLGLGAARRRR